jgi:hypothetical protein
LLTPEFDAPDNVHKFHGDLEANNSGTVLVFYIPDLDHLRGTDFFTVPAYSSDMAALFGQGPVLPRYHDLTESWGIALINNKDGKPGASGDTNSTAVAQTIINTGNGIDVLTYSDCRAGAGLFARVAGNLLIAFKNHIGTGLAPVIVGQLGFPV